VFLHRPATVYWPPSASPKVASNIPNFQLAFGEADYRRRSAYEVREPHRAVF
jgi:hypothetical protein